MTQERSGPDHYLTAALCADNAAAALNDGDTALAAALAAVGQVYATLAAAAAATLHPDFTDHATLRAWKEVTGQD